jgi:hypothetical protein
LPGPQCTTFAAHYPLIFDELNPMPRRPAAAGPPKREICRQSIAGRRASRPPFVPIGAHSWIASAFLRALCASVVNPTPPR